ncbi:MAG TPA: hypothetical protein QF621_03070 [Candidatus Thalassarchaeaceae archaeon]|nr:hypothetical protein [Candidatus Thalassarchaeaceae archaeon]
MRNYLLIYVNGRRHQISGERCFQSLSDYLRHDLGLVGTKVVCAEGDCGLVLCWWDVFGMES